MRIKRSLKVVALVLAALLFFPSAALAALPNNTIVFGNKAYDLSLLNDTTRVNEILAAFVANGNTFAYVRPAGTIIDPNAQPVTNTASWPAIAYAPATGATVTYEAGNGAPVPTAVTVAATAAASSIQAGATTQITATATPSDATITYASSDEAKATVSATGLVTGVAAGSATITVTAAKTGMTSGTATVNITVTAMPVVSLTAAATLSVVDQATAQIAVTANPTDAVLAYASSDNTVATVNATGLVTAHKPGTATIAINGTRTGYTAATPVTVTVTVTKAASVITTVEVAAVSVEENKTATPSVAVKNQYGDAMTTGFTLGYSVNNAVVSVNATTGVITAAAYSASAHTATLTVTATPTTGTAKTGTATVTVTADTTKPTIVSASATDAKHIVVVFSEPVTAATAQTVANYQLYSYSSTTLYAMQAPTADSATVLVATAVLGPDNKTVTITLVDTDDDAAGPGGGWNTSAMLAGFVLGGMTNSNYMVYASNIADRAAMANTIAANSNVQFTASTSPDSAGPVVTSAAYDSGLLQLQVVFDETPTIIDQTKVSVVNGSNTVTLTAGNASVISGTTITWTLSAAQNTTLGTLGAGATANLVAVAVKDVANNNNLASTTTITALIRPAVTVAAYDETTNKVTITLNKAVTFASITDLTKFRIQYKADTGAWTDLVSTANFNTNFPLDTLTGTSGTSIVFKPSAAGIAQINAQKNTAGTVTYQFGITDLAMTDTAGNQNDTGAPGGASEVFVAMTYTAETVLPVINEAKYYVATDAAACVTTQTMYVKFDQKVQGAIVAGKVVVKYGATATTVDATVVGGNITTVATLDLNGLGMTIVLTAGGQTNMAANTTTIKIGVLAGSGLKDMNNNLMAAQEYAVQYIDNTPFGAFTALEHSSKQVFITWASGQLDETIAETIGNWTVYLTGNPNATTPLASAEMIDTDANGTKDTLVLNVTTGSALAVTAGTNYTVGYSNLKDTTAKTITNGTTAFASLAAEETTAPLLATGIVTGSNIKAAQYSDVDASSTINAGDTLTLVFNEPIVAPAAASLEAQFGTVGTASAARGADSNILVITFGTSPTLAFGAGVVGPNGIKDVATVAFAGTGFVTAPAAAAAPKPTSAVALDVNGDGVLGLSDTITVTYDKPVFLKGGRTVAHLVDDFSFSTAVVVKSVALSGSTAVITLNTGTVMTCGTGGTTVDTNVANVDIQNSWKVDATIATGGAKVVAGTDTVGPTIASVMYNDNSPAGNDANDTITITFNKAIVPNMATLAVGDFAFGNGGITPTSLIFTQTSPTTVVGAVYAAGGFDVVANTATLRLATAIEPKITDAYNNSAVRGAAMTITTGTADVAAPTVVRIKWNNKVGGTVDTLEAADNIVVTFSEAIDPTTLGLAIAPLAGGTAQNEADGDNVITWSAANDTMTIKNIATVRLVSVTGGAADDQIWSATVSADGKTVTYALVTAGTVPTFLAGDAADAPDDANSSITGATVTDLAGKTPANVTNIDAIVDDASRF
jgi:hypothetical protein